MSWFVEGLKRRENVCLALSIEACRPRAYVCFSAADDRYSRHFYIGAAKEARDNVLFTLRSKDGADADGQNSFSGQVCGSVLRQLFLAGKDVRKSATVEITLLDSGDGAGGDEDGRLQTDPGCGSRALALSPTTLWNPGTDEWVCL